MGIDEKRLIEALCADLNFDISIATAYVRARGRCEYCGADLLRSRLGYAIAQLDHILPRREYPDTQCHENNWALSCMLCNSVKGDFDCLKEGEDPEMKLMNQRSQLIERVRTEIARKMVATHDPYWIKANELLGHLWWNLKRNVDT